MKVWFLMNENKEFVIKNYSDKILFSKDKIHQALSYTFKNRALHKLHDNYFWERYDIDPKLLTPIEVELSMKIIGDEDNG
jgi:hypothetical protein